jgi:hypothetical protein
VYECVILSTTTDVYYVVKQASENMTISLVHLNNVYCNSILYVFKSALITVCMFLILLLVKVIAHVDDSFD